MALQPASDATAASDSTTVIRPVLSGLTINAINTAITAQTARTDTDDRVIRLTLAATMNNLGQAQIIQSDDTKVFLTDIVDALTASPAGYRVSYKYIRKSREGASDRVKLQVAWS